MLGVTFFGLIFTPVFYVFIRMFGGKKSAKPMPVPVHVEAAPVAAGRIAKPPGETAIQTDGSVGHSV
jgi:hypothetical protein